MSIRSTTLTLQVLALVAILTAFVFPWHHPAEAAEWDDGEHAWGRNIHDTSLFVSDLGTEVEEDPDGVTLRQAGFWAFLGGLSVTTIAFLFAVVDRRAWAITLGWIGWTALAAGAGGIVGGILYELSDVADLGLGVGLIAGAIAVVSVFVANWTSIGLGKSEAAQRRREEHRLHKKLRAEERERQRIAEETTA